MLKIIPYITFSSQGIPNDLVQSNCFHLRVPIIIVFADVMRTVRHDNTATDLFTEGAHNHNISNVFIIQNLILSTQAEYNYKCKCILFRFAEKSVGSTASRSI